MSRDHHNDSERRHVLCFVKDDHVAFQLNPVGAPHPCHYITKGLNSVTTPSETICNHDDGRVPGSMR